MLTPKQLAQELVLTCGELATILEALNDLDATSWPAPKRAILNLLSVEAGDFSQRMTHLCTILEAMLNEN